MCNVWLAFDHLYGKWLFAWLSLVVSMMVFFCAVLFPHEMHWMRSGIEMSWFLKIFRPSLTLNRDEYNQAFNLFHVKKTDKTFSMQHRL